MSDLAEAIRTHMKDGGEPITFEEIAALDVSSLPAPRRRPLRNDRVATLNGSSGAPRALRLPAVGWAAFVVGALVVILGLVVVDPSSTGPAGNRQGPGPGPRTTHPTTPSASRILVVPNVLGMTADEANSALRDAGFKAIKVRVSSSRSVASGKVAAQAPSADVQVLAGTTVELYVSTGPPQVPPPSTTTGPVGAQEWAPAGIFADGSTGTPYYFISLFEKRGDVSGSVDFLHQDGQTSVVFTFEGTMTAESLTLHPTNASIATSTSEPEGTTTVPTTIQATVGDALTPAIELDNCTAYLSFATSARQCVFQRVEEGIGAAPSDFKDGIYSDGPPGTSHYVATVVSTSGNELTGALEHVSADGQSSQTFSFTGPLQGSVSIVQPTSPTSSASIPQAISLVLGETGLSFGECFSYLPYIESNAQCTFTYGPG